MLSRCASNQAPSTSRPSTPAQPKHQISMSRALHTAGSFLGDFPTPEGVRNSSRERTDCFRQRMRKADIALWGSAVSSRNYASGHLVHHRRGREQRLGDSGQAAHHCRLPPALARGKLHSSSRARSKRASGLPWTASPIHARVRASFQREASDAAQRSEEAKCSA